MKNLKSKKVNDFYNFCFYFLVLTTLYSCSIHNNTGDVSYVNFENNVEINLRENAFLIID